MANVSEIRLVSKIEEDKVTGQTLIIRLKHFCIKLKNTHNVGGVKKLGHNSESRDLMIIYVLSGMLLLP